MKDETVMNAAMTGPYPLLLASKSEARQRLMRDLGFVFETLNPGVDEQEVKRALVAQQATGSQIAETLAELKAQKASALKPGALCIGGDQVLVCGDVHFDKPVDMDHAKAQLMALSGKDHRLETSVCLVLNGQRLWHQNDVALLTMRTLTQEDIDRYLAFVGEAVLHSVGCYRLEKEGAFLLTKVTGDPYVVQGLPLIPLVRQLSHLGYPGLAAVSPV